MPCFSLSCFLGVLSRFGARTRRLQLAPARMALMRSELGALKVVLNGAQMVAEHAEIENY
ncbi:TPA: hypothetical protein ACOEB2_003198 [Enterobacter cloacae]